MTLKPKKSEALYRSVRKVIEQGRKAVSIAANAVLVRQNWTIGKLIVEHEQQERRKADYGKKTLEALSLRLTADYGRGHDASFISLFQFVTHCVTNWDGRITASSCARTTPLPASGT